ncbi:hypothetical protein [Flavobacterium oreochromis]|uniref:Phage abortive infection protein n=2 Tax=Flavobacterium TaxID=237 RepID=A0A246G850_9FLAO|nr:hypothetical protein [Flavobacterium oreochromis]OWP74937.1 hypothetical protein BWK62_13085 [Flavobacterium oreochromis]OWP75969.1 hypothetical protein BWG23_09315 [Flavobacterium oreochromis]POR24049.1 hypothetical protein BWK58_08935 [Flavobacterium columnare]QYS86211.1 hypothetical protein JJC03_14830 [Flavobacterium oreochromis]
MIFKKNNVDIYAKWILLFGALLTIILPFSISTLGINFLGKYGTVGDTIGGITSPISQFIGSILIYLALKAQLDANKIVQEQIDEDNKLSLIKHDVEQIHELYIFFQNNIKSFSYERIAYQKSQIIYGKRAIKLFFQSFETISIDVHSDTEILKIDGVREILSIINSAKLILQKIKKSDISVEDKQFYFTIIYHELVFSIFPAHEIENEDPLALKKCQSCNLYHHNFPPLIFHKIQDLKNEL